MRRSLFSKLLLSNWLLLLVLIVAAGAVLFTEKFIHPDFRFLLFSFYVLFAMFGTFYMSYSIAKSVSEPLDRIEKKPVKSTRVTSVPNYPFRTYENLRTSLLPST